MAGTWLNVIGIVAGAIFGWLWRKPLSHASQLFFKAGLGAATVLCGLRLAWVSLNGPPLQVLKQTAVVLIALTLGRITGRLVRLQKTSNRLGAFARDRMAAATPANPIRFSDGFLVCTLLFCAAPLGMVGAISDGLGEYPAPLAVKAVMDGLAAMSFVAMFGLGVVLSAVPVLVFQGTLSLLCARFLLPFLEQHQLVDSVNATCGFLIVAVSLILFEVRKIEVTDYLPGLLFAPLLTHWLR